MQTIGLLIADEIQLVGGEVGPTYEVVISRTRYVSAQTELKTRIVACGVSLANARDLGEWMGAPTHAIFNFPPRLVTNIRWLQLRKLNSNHLVRVHSIWTFTSRASRFLSSPPS